MKKQKWRGLPTRLAALGLAAALCLGLPPVSALAEGEGEAPGGDSSSEFVGSDNLLDIFTYNKNSFSGGYVSGNDMYLADTSETTPHWAAAFPNDYGCISSVTSKNMVSLKADWEFVSSFSVEYIDKMTYASLIAQVGTPAEPYIFFSRVGHLIGNTNTIGFYPHGSDMSAYASEALSPDLLNGRQAFTIKYSAATQTMTIDFGGTTCSYKTAKTGHDKANFSFTAECGWPKANHDGLDRVYSVGGTFSSAKYTHYQPQFVSTELLDEDGNTMTDAEKMALKDGDVVTVRSTVKNNHPEA
ncbi:hypothetical protein, partial [Bittarella massiliensis (ex Durand et al. 2017)]|uniref:hypothetical protein n=1 Tax=Bittarella massiliensis (ex Durand et al. 2017) TaxID=1720313 RepID=UPI001AA14D81